MFFISKRILAAALGGVLVAGCSKPHEPAQVMWQSPVPPADVPSKTPLTDGFDYSKILVRLFPILKTPKGEPYPVSQDRDVVELQNDQGISLWANGMQVAPAAKDVQLNFRDKKYYLKNLVQGDVQAMEVAALEVTVKGGGGATRVTYNKGLGAAESTRLYRGEFTVTPTEFTYNENGESKKGTFWSLINVVELEHYLISVVPSEVPVSWHPNALDAQAVAARTYAVKELVEARKKKQNWDVDPTTQYQSYRGVTIEKEPSTAAVERTRGVVMTYKGEIFLSFFAANSGGITCAASDCLERPDAEYALSKTDAIEMETQNVTGGTWKACTSLPLITYHLALWGFDKPAPTFGLPPTELNGVKRPPEEICLDQAFAKAVQNDLAPSLAAKDLEVLDKSASGRIWSLTAVLKSGKKIKLKENGRLRTRALMYGRQSHLLKLRPAGADGLIEITGHGYGHGVGMSQWGAKLRADKGQGYQEILKFYYSGIAFENLARFTQAQ